MSSSRLLRRLVFAAFTISLVGNATGHAGLESPRPRRTGAYSCGNRGDGVGKPQYTVPGLTCGLCGDDISIRSSAGVWRPRDIEYGGKWGKKGPLAVYTEGETIDVKVAIWNPHNFFMEFRLSPNASWELTRNQTAFSYLLKVSLDSYTPAENISAGETTPFITQDSSSPTRLKVNTYHRAHGNGRGPGYDIWVKAKVKLPVGLVCENCVLQFNYRARAMETFRSCADIRIIPAESNPPFDLIVSSETGRCLSGGTAMNLSLVVCNSSDPLQRVYRFQHWKQYEHRSGKVALKSTNTCLDVLQNRTSNGSPVRLFPCPKVKYHDDGKNQRWIFDKVENNSSFQLVSDASGRCLSIKKKTGQFVIYDCYESPLEATAGSTYHQYWTIKKGNIMTERIPSNVINPITNGIAYCPHREAGTPEGCYDIEPSESNSTPPFKILKNLDTGKCLTHSGVNKSLVLTRCNTSNPHQSVTLFQPLANYNNWTHGVALHSPKTCLDFSVKWWNDGLRSPVTVRNCKLSVNEYKENQLWGFKMTEKDASFQIFSQSYAHCLSVSRKTGNVWLYKCFNQTSVAKQHWTLVTTVLEDTTKESATKSSQSETKEESEEENENPGNKLSDVTI